MTLTEQRRNAYETICADLVTMFDNSDVEYTCANAILNVIRDEAEKRCDAANLALRARRVMNMTVETIHRRKFPKPL